MLKRITKRAKLDKKYITANHIELIVYAKDVTIIGNTKDDIVRYITANEVMK